VKEWAKKNVTLSILITISIPVIAVVADFVGELATKDDLRKSDRLNTFRFIESGIAQSKMMLIIYNQQDSLSDKDQAEYNLLLEKIKIQSQKREGIIDGTIDFNNIY